MLNRRNLIFSCAVVGSFFGLMKNLSLFGNLATGSDPIMPNSQDHLNANLKYLKKYHEFNDLTKFLDKQNVKYQIINSFEHSLVPTQNLKLFSLNRSYGRFANFSGDDKSYESAFVVTKGPQGKKLKDHTGLNVVNYLSKEISSKLHFTDALPHFYNLKNFQQTRYQSYWVDSSTRPSIDFYLKINGGSLSETAEHKVQALSKKLDLAIGKFESYSLELLRKKCPVFEFADLLKPSTPHV